MQMCVCIHSIDAYMLHIYTLHMWVHICSSLCGSVRSFHGSLPLSSVFPVLPSTFQKEYQWQWHPFGRILPVNPSGVAGKSTDGTLGTKCSPLDLEPPPQHSQAGSWVPRRIIEQTWLQWWTSQLLQTNNMTCTLNTLINALKRCNACLSVLFYILGLAKFQNIATNN